jgi:pimeloyl-ACP methyl ester carboxylesterase
MHGDPGAVMSADGTTIGVATHGCGPPLLLVHGGMCSSSRWAPLWALLTGSFTVTAMDRRGRGLSPDLDTIEYSLEAEYQDVAAVCGLLADRHQTPVDVFAHSYGALCALGAAAAGAQMRRLVLYEPPGPQTLTTQWLERARALVAQDQLGRALVSFLVDITGMTPAAVEALRHEAREDNPLPVVANTMLREAEALTSLDLAQIAEHVHQPVHLLLGSTSPPWARAVTDALTDRLTNATTVILTGHGHEAVDTAPHLVAHQLAMTLLPF